MTRNEILEVAGKFYKPETITEREIAFARHMMNYEREACAKVCESIDMEAFGVLPVRAVMIANHCAAAIRARGNHE